MTSLQQSSHAHGTGHSPWLAVGLACAERVDLVDWGGGRTAVYEALSVSHGFKPNTLRRMVTAARYALRESAACGLPMAAVTAPLAAIETLMGIERESRSAAAAIKRAALTGAMSTPALTQSLAGLRGAKVEERSRRKAEAEGRPEGGADAAAMAGALAAMPRGATAPVGRVGQLLSVDLEFQTPAPQAQGDEDADDGDADDEEAEGPPDALTHAAFLSPRLAHARLAGQPLEEVAIRAIAATRAYDRVHVVAADAAEADALTRLVADLTRAAPVDVDVIDGG